MMISKTKWALALMLMLLLPGAVLLAQSGKPQPPAVAPNRPRPTAEQLAAGLTSPLPGIPPAESRLTGAAPARFRPLAAPALPTSPLHNLNITIDPATGLPYWITGEVQGLTPSNDPAVAGRQYWAALQSTLKVADAANAFQLLSAETDEQGITHTRWQQYHLGVPVYGAEVRLHLRQGKVYLFNGRYFPTPSLSSIAAQVSAAQAETIVRGHLGVREGELSAQEAALLGSPAWTSALVVYHVGQDIAAGRLAWQVDATPHLADNWRYFIDAQSGAILHRFNRVCRLHHHAHERHAAHTCTSHESEDAAVMLPPDGPAVANATDLLGASRQINTYVVNNVYHFIDASRPMFNAAQSNFPDDGVGIIWTLNAGNTSPSNDNFSVSYITSNNNTWNNARAVSAHYNAGRAYEYFRTTFNRNSINGQGGNIISVINVVEDDGSQMDNAFWNGRAMFYGNGNQDFSAPLAKSLDVAGHEMSHGVIENTANLEYQDESGAMNESFADIFGVMIDRDDWRLGEDVVNTSVFVSGALRDMANPANGGTQLGHPGWQPGHVNQQYQGSADNGGVHINSGIVNRAFYLFATQVGKDKAEQIYYRALANYLTRSSRFVDLRLAVIQSANDLYGNTEANAAAQAFTTVGIGQGAPTNTQEDLESNPGDAYVLYTDRDNDRIFLARPDGQIIGNPLSNLSLLSRPTVTDDGSVIVFVASDKTLRSISINWNTGQTSPFTMSSEPVWRSAAISRDGNRLAAVTDDYDNRVYVFDFTTNPVGAITYELVNGTYSPNGATTGDVVYADVLEWDHSGRYLLFDALNSIATQVGQDIEYWDIGVLDAWDIGADDFGSGESASLFTGLPENTSVGNPTFAKNSPYIIAFDYFDNGGTYYLFGVNVETGESGLLFENNRLNWPNYSPYDDYVLFDATSSSTGREVLGVVELANDKINPTGNPFIFLEGNDIYGARWGVWFANGERELVNTGQAPQWAGAKAFPQPFRETLELQLPEALTEAAQLQLFDLAGRQVYETTMPAGAGQFTLRPGQLPSGAYVLRIQSGARAGAFRVMKQ